MLKLLQDLVAHKGHANRMMLEAIRQHQVAAEDPDILALAHHVLVANRFWYLLWVGEPFVAERELQPPDSFDAVMRGYEALQTVEEAWVTALSDAGVSRVLETPHIPGGRCSVAEGIMQVCLHSHGHRAQIAKMFRALGGSPPMTDFILWVAERSRPVGPGQGIGR